MNSLNNINIKNQTDITDLEIGSFNEEEEQFINKKQLVHIDDDTSINVDISDDDRSKSSTLKKSFLINNISAFNEQFQINNQIENKKNENENDLNDISNSADFYNNDNVVGNFPLIMSDRSKEIINSKNLNNDDMMQSLGTNIDNNGYFFEKQNERNNIKCSTNKKINIKNNGLNMSIKDIDDEEEEDEFDENNNIKMMLQKKMNTYNTVNENKNKINNIEYIQNNSDINNKISNYNSNSIKQNILQVNNFCLYILGNNKYNSSVNTSEQTFGLLQSQSKDFQNKYNQLESKYNALLEQNRKLKESYEELKSSNKSVLDLLTYWQKFYLEILEIVRPKTNKNDISINDYMDDPYRIQVINDVKKIVLISRDKVYNKFYINQINNFDIKGKENKDLNLGNKTSDKNNGSNNINNGHKKYLNEDDDLNSLPPIRYHEKINTGVNTEITGENNNNQPIIKEIIKEVEVIKKSPNQKFEEIKLKISSKVHSFSYTKTFCQKKELKRNNSGTLNNYKKLKSNLTSSNSKTNIKDIDKKKDLLKICSSFKLNFKSIPPKTPKKLKKNVMHKVAMVQTDMTYKNINSIEALNKACSSQLLNSQREKEKMQKLYEEKIASLNDYINENIKLNKKEKNKKINKNKDNNNKSKDENLLKNKNDEDAPSSNIENQFIFIPEMIPPENTYKIFIHCVKHFKYEEDIYKKYLEEEDLYTLKAFVEKMEKYLIGTSLPVLKNNKKVKKEKSEKKIIINNSNNYKYIKPENNTNKKYKENYRNNNGKIKSLNAKLRISYNSENNIGESEKKKNSIYNNNNTFNKYKAAILALKDY